MTDNKEEPKQKVVIKLVKEAMLNKDGKEIRGPDKEIQYKREDIIGLQSLINRYDSKKHPGSMKLIKALLNVKDKVELCWRKDEEVLNLTLDEASQLKEYLSKILDLDAQNDPLKQFELRTLIGTLEQLE